MNHLCLFNFPIIVPALPYNINMENTIRTNVEDMGFLAQGPFILLTKDEYDLTATHYYRLKFWSVAEYGDDFVALMNVVLPDEKLVSIASEDPEQSNFLDTVMTIFDEKTEYTEAERQYFGKIADLLFWFEKEFESGRAISNQVITWKRIEDIT